MSDRPKSSSSPLLVLLFLLASAFALATILHPMVDGWRGRKDSDEGWKIMLGEGRRIFANHFFVQADASFHSGYYPSVFDQAAKPKNTRHMTSAHEEDHHHDAEEEEKKLDFFGPPKDWVERFGRKFMISEHTHLENGDEREILPWLKISAELDPQRVETYVVSAYWLRNRLGKVKEAEAFLREGLRNNPNSHQILFELGRLYYDNSQEIDRPRNLWEMALGKWKTQEAGKPKPDLLALDEIAAHLAVLEEKAGRLDKALSYLELAKTASPSPQAIDQRISELKSKMAAGTTNVVAPH